MNFDLMKRRDAIVEAQGKFLAYRQRDQTAAFFALIEVLIEDYQFDLLIASKDGLEKKQGAAAQLIAFRQFLLDPTKFQNLKI